MAASGAATAVDGGADGDAGESGAPGISYIDCEDDEADEGADPGAGADGGGARGGGDEGQDEGDGGALAASPFGATGLGGRKDAVPGAITLSDGRVLPGRIYTTRAKRLKVFNLAEQRYEYVPVPACVRIEAVVEWERIDREWRFKEAGNPEKVYTGRTYPLRMLAWRLTLRNGHQITGHILGQPLYVTEGGAAERWILHARHKGPMGGSLEALTYIRRVDLGRAAQAAARAEGAGAGDTEEKITHDAPVH